MESPSALQGPTRAQVSILRNQRLSLSLWGRCFSHSRQGPSNRTTNRGVIMCTMGKKERGPFSGGHSVVMGGVWGPGLGWSPPGGKCPAGKAHVLCPMRQNVRKEDEWPFTLDVDFPRGAGIPSSPLRPCPGGAACWAGGAAGEEESGGWLAFGESPRAPRPGHTGVHADAHTCGESNTSSTQGQCAVSGEDRR